MRRKAEFESDLERRSGIRTQRACTYQKENRDRR